MILGKNINVNVSKTPIKTGEQTTISLLMPNFFGYVTDVEVLFNRFGENTGAERVQRMEYNGYLSNNEYSVFEANVTFETPGYRTFVIQLKVDGVTKRIQYNAESEKSVLTGVDATGYSYWEIFVYYSSFKTPDNLKGGIMYQIFVDTFACSNPTEETKSKIVDWKHEVKWEPDGDGIYRNNQFYGGNLRGIIEKLDYIKSLGVNAIYLTPIFKSPSSNRYDIEDFEEIDEMVGTWEDLKELHEKANNLGIYLIIDVVFNHSSSSNKILHEDPETYDWIHKYDEPKCWWGFSGLIEFNKYNENYIFHLKEWLKLYAKYVDGIRLDVADSLPDDTLKLIRENFKKYILGEVWKNAVTGDHRDFFLGDELDGVMNYRFANAIYLYVRWGNYKEFKKIINNIYDLYPHEALAVSPIFLSSHDIPRIPNILVGDYMRGSGDSENVWDMEKDNNWYVNGKFDTYRFRSWEYNHKLKKEEKELADKLQELAVFMSYTLPGLPVIFAGDEAGVEGYKDPFNRRTFPWDDIDYKKYSFYCAMGKFRNEFKGNFYDNDNFELLEINENYVIYRRGDLTMVVNRTPNQIRIESVDLSNKVFSLNGVCADIQSVPPYGAYVVKNF